MQTTIQQADGSTQTYNGGKMNSSTPAPTTVSAPTSSSNPSAGSYTPSHSSSPSTNSSLQSGLDQLGQLYNQAMATGNTNLAQQYHDQANQMRASNGMQLYHDSNFDNSSQPQTGTTGTTSLASKMLSAAQNPTTETTNWNIGGTTLKTPVYNGRSVASMADLASSLGIQYTKDPSTGAITVNGNKVNPVGYDANGVPQVQVRQILNAMGVPDEQIQYDQKTGNVSVQLPQQQPQFKIPYLQTPQFQQMPYLQPQQLPNYMPSLMQSMPQMPQLQAYQAPDLSSYYNQMTPYSQFNPNWTNYYNQAHQQFDPTTNQQVSDLMTKQRGDITASDEKMNQRGIFNSGIAQAVEDDIRAKTSNSIAKVFTAAQSNIAKVAQQLYTDAYDQWYKGNDLALKNNQMMLTQINGQQKQAFSNWLSTQQLSLSQYNYAMSAWDHMATLIQNDAKMSMDNSQFYQKENSSIAQFNSKSAMDNQQYYDKLNQMIADANQKNAQQMYQFNHLSADQSANLAQKQFQFNNLSASQKATNQLDLFKMLGYVQMPDGSVKPTEQTTRDQQDMAIKLAQTLGYYTTADGKIVPTQQANYQNGMLQLDNNKLTAQIHQWAADNQLKSAQIGLDQQKLDEKSQYDQAMIDKASASAQDTAKRTQLEGLKSQMISVTDQMKAYQAAGNTPPQSLVDQYNNIMNSVDKVSGASSNDTSSLNAGFPLQGTPSGSFSNFSNNGGGGDSKGVIQQVASKYGMDPKILYTIAQKESGMNPNVSPNENSNGTTDYGMMQINTGDAQDNGWSVSRLQSDLGYNVEAAAKTLVEKAKMLQRIGEPVNLFNLFKAYNGWSAQGAQYAQDAVNIYNSMS